MLTSEFDYTLPESLIAQVPAPERHDSRLMIVCYQSKEIIHTDFKSMSSYIDSESLLVVNNTKVFPARLYGHKDTGGVVEILLVRAVDEHCWEAMVRPSARIVPGTSIRLNGCDCLVTVDDRLPDGKRLVSFAAHVDPIQIAIQHGRMPLPPYIKRTASDDLHDALDIERYQTIFARDIGSVAAPTASLHFTQDVLHDLSKKNVRRAEVTLHVGPGTFKPVKTDMITDHAMDYEYYIIDAANAAAINDAHRQDKPIIGVGTTVVRTLESNADPSGVVYAGEGKTDLFIYPGYRFKLVNNMLTNFHLPKSTLLMLVCALAGKDLVMRAYRQAIEAKYRFYSYGDAMLLLNQ